MPVPPELQLLADLPYGPLRQRPHLLDVLRPKQPALHPVPAVLFLHGGGWHMFGKYPEINRFLAQQGWVTAASNYRYSSEAVFPAQLEDAQAAVGWLRQNAQELGIDPQRIGVWGISAGGHLAALLGALGEVQAAVCLCAPTDFLDPQWSTELSNPQGEASRLLGQPPFENVAQAALASPVYRVSPLSAPCLVVHGARDRLVPLSQAQALQQAYLEVDVPCRLWVIDDGDHFINETHLPQIQSRVLEFFGNTWVNPKHTLEEA